MKENGFWSDISIMTRCRRGVYMANKVRQIQIGRFESDKSAAEAIVKTKEMLQKIAEETYYSGNIAALPGTVLQITSETLVFLLDAAREALGDEAVQNAFIEAGRNAQSTTADIQAIIDDVKNTLEDLPKNTDNLLRFSEEDLKKIITWLGLGTK